MASCHSTRLHKVHAVAKWRCAGVRSTLDSWSKLPADDDEALPGDDEDFVAGEGVAEALRTLESGGKLIDMQVRPPSPR